MIPSKIGRYEIVDELGRGGMATVYRAQDPRFKRDVAVKLMPAQFLSETTFRARFEREAQTIAALEHPAIVPVYDFGEEDGQPYLVMRYMPGGSLADKLAHGPMSPSEASHIIARISSALDQVHARGIIHRDLKPANVLFDQYDEAYLSDFGIARLTEATTNLTGDSIVGTPAYMSPEQARGELDIDGRSDLYALGVMLFQMLTGKQPYEAPTPIAVAMKHITDPVPRLSQTRPDLSSTYDRLIESAMAKDRRDRFPTGNDLFTALEKAMLEAGYAISRPIETPATALNEPVVHKPPVARPATPPPGGKPPSSPGVSRPATPQPGGRPPSSPGVAKPVTPLPVARPVSHPAIAKPRRGVPLWAWIVIGILGIGLICGALSIAGVFLNDMATTLPTPTLEQVYASSPKDTPTPGSTPKIEEPTPTLVEATRTWQSGDTIIEDDFTDLSSGWPAYKGVNGYSRYQADAYRVYVDLPNDRIEATLGVNVADVKIETDASKVGGPDDNLFGVICRYQDRKNFYLFIITSDGYYAVGKVVNGEYQLNDGRMLPDQYIKKGNATNSLEAECAGQDLTLWVNGTQVASIQDDTFQSGDIGVLAGTYTISGSDILFDNFRAYIP